MNFKSVLIVTYGRSGSTLLQGLLNSIEGCLVRGENYNFCYSLYQAYLALSRSKTEHGSEDKPNYPWFGAHAIDEARFLADARALVYHQLLGDDNGEKAGCLGFKEIRYYEVPDVQAYLRFLEKLFPEPAFLVLTREHAQVLKSGWWSADADAKLKQFEAGMREFAAGKAHVFVIDYRDMVERTGRLRELFEFLGAPYEKDRIEKVLSTPHSFTPAPGPARETLSLAAEAIRQCPQILYLALDPLPESGEPPESLTLGGVLVLKRDAEQGAWNLWVIDADGRRPVQWGLPAPKMCLMYPENPYAAHARFKAEGVTVRKEAPVRIVIEAPSGETWDAAKVKATNTPVIK